MFQIEPIWSFSSQQENSRRQVEWLCFVDTKGGTSVDLFRAQTCSLNHFQIVGKI